MSYKAIVKAITLSAALAVTVIGQLRAQTILNSPAAKAESSPVRNLITPAAHTHKVPTDQPREINKTNREPFRHIDPKAKHSADQTVSSKNKEKKATAKKADESK